MRNDKAKIYSLEIILFLSLFLALFVPNILKSRLIVAVFLTLYALVTLYVVKGKSKFSIYQRKEFLLLVLLAIIYLVIYYMFGMYTGFKPSVVKLSLNTIFKYIMPVVVIIVTTEIIRSRFLIEKSKLSFFLTLGCGILIDLIVYANVNQLNNLDGFLLILGYVFFASCASNLLYNYLSKRFGMNSVIAYKIITNIYIYIIPVVPDLYLFFNTFIRLIYPYVIYIIVDNLFSKIRKENAIIVNNKKSTIINGSLIVVMILIVMLVSCRFMYGILVIGSKSMTGVINKGDAIIFKQYRDKDNLKVGDVVVFQKDDVKIVHRLIEIKKINNEYRFYTKGDKNKEVDEGFIKQHDIVGVVKLRIKYIGLPTLYLRELFERE